MVFFLIQVVVQEKHTLFTEQVCHLTCFAKACMICNKKYTSFKESLFLKTFLFVNTLKLKMIIYCKLAQTDF